MEMVVQRPRPTGSFRLFLRLVGWLIIFTIVAGAGLWWFGPELIAPREAFEQGPGGVVAYVSLANQLRTQTQAFLSGQDVRLVMNQDEFSGMVSSALLSGRTASNPLRRVRAYLPEGQIQVDMILELPYPQVPERYRNSPVGLTLDLRPTIGDTGEVQFQITHAKLGAIRVPVSLLKWAGQRVPSLNLPGYDARGAAIELPIGAQIAASFGRKITIEEFASTKGELALVMRMSTKKQ